MQRKEHKTKSPEDFLSTFPEDLRNWLLKEGSRREYQKADLLLSPGDTGSRIGVILAGRAHVVLHEPGYREISVEELGPGDSFGEINFLSGRASPPNWKLVAAGPCTAVEVDSEVFEQATRAHPEFSYRLLKRLARKVIRLDRTIFESKRRRRALQHLISGEGSAYPEYVKGSFFRRRLEGRIKELISSDGPILILGESGVGRELLAYSIFKMADSYKEIFLLCDISPTNSDGDTESAPESGLESVKDGETLQIELLFGREEIDADGSKREVPGYVELCEGGTLLIRGVEHLLPSTQQRLLTTLETGSFRLSNQDSLRRANFRLIATSKLTLHQEIDSKEHPLITQLMERSVFIPPLKERRREITTLADHYISLHSKELRKEAPSLPEQSLKMLLSYSWPGNDLELSNTLRRAILVAQEGVIRPSDIYFEVKRAEGEGKINLMRLEQVGNTVRSPLFPAVLQSALAPFFFILLGLLFLGPVDPLQNPASLMCWAIGWPALIGMAIVWARHWCALCPMGTMGHLSKKILALEKPFPSFLKNRSEIVVTAAVLTILWLEIITNMRQSPLNLGILLLAVTILSVAFSMVFERQSWCRYLCPLGGMTGLMAKASILELRADRNVCSSKCGTHECYEGTDKTMGCPFGQLAPTVHSNLECKLCGMCVKSCPHGAINLNLRIPGKELVEMERTSSAMAFLSVAIPGALLAELAYQTPAYSAVRDSYGLPNAVALTILFLSGIIGTNLLVLLAAFVSKWFLKDSTQHNYAIFGVALIPLTLASLLAHHIYYFITLGVQLPVLVSQNFDLAIFQDLVIKLSPNTTLLVQTIIVIVGLAWTALIMMSMAKSSVRSRISAVLGLGPHLAASAIIAVLVVQSIGSTVH